MNKIIVRFVTLVAGIAFQTAAAAESPAADLSCSDVCQQVSDLVGSKPSQMLETIAAYVKLYPQFAGEVVMAAILSAEEPDGEKASAKTVASIVEAALRAAPEGAWPAIVQSAVAAAPDAIAAIATVVLTLAPNNPALAALVTQSPLDPPGGGGKAMPGASVAPPVIVNPPATTEVNPGPR